MTSLAEATSTAPSRMIARPTTADQYRPGHRRSTVDQPPVVEITIAELARIEERLSVQAHLGDLHPAHARRLAAVSAELDRRWAMFV